MSWHDRRLSGDSFGSAWELHGGATQGTAAAMWNACVFKEIQKRNFRHFQTLVVGSYFSLSLVFPWFILILDDQEDLKTPDPSWGHGGSWSQMEGLGCRASAEVKSSPSAPRFGTSGPTTCSTAMAGEANSRAWRKGISTHQIADFIWFYGVHGYLMINHGFFLAFLARASLRGHGRTAAFPQLFYDSSVPFSEIQCLWRSLNFKLVHPLLIYKSPIFSWKLSHLFRQLSDWSLQEIWPCGEQHRCVGLAWRSRSIW